MVYQAGDSAGDLYYKNASCRNKLMSFSQEALCYFMLLGNITGKILSR